MNKTLAFFGREKELRQLARLYAERRHVLIVGPPGIGKTALLRQVRQHCPMLLCEETSSLRRICDGIERQLGWRHYKMNVIERKNRLLTYAERRGEPVALDHVALTPPRVSRFIEHLAERVPVWIACRSTLSDGIGHVWQHLYKFTRIELPPLTLAETCTLIEHACALENIQSDARRHITQLYRLSRDNLRILEEILMELSAREYRMDKSFGLHLLDLDRRIQEFAMEHISLSDSPN